MGVNSFRKFEEILGEKTKIFEKYKGKYARKTFLKLISKARLIQFQIIRFRFTHLKKKIL
jgi:hypothetical protein